jgi:hypothetical protein
LAHLLEQNLSEEEIHMRVGTLLKKTLLITSVVGMLLPGLGVAGAFQGTDCVSETKRPLSDFLGAQGTSGDNPEDPSFFPPVPDYVGWAGSDFVTFALVDYAGLADAWLGQSLHTQVTGQVRECTLPADAEGNVKARVTVKLVTANALGFAQSIADLAATEPDPFDFDQVATNFGAKAVDVAAGAEAATGTAFLTTIFTIANPGDPLPDFLDVNFTTNYAPASLDFSSTTVGRRPDGTRAILKVEQVATQGTDGVWIYTVENVEIVDPGQ